MARPRGPMGPKPKIEHPFRLLGRVLGFTLSKYGFQYALVLIFIVVSVLCNLQGTKFMQNLIDDYITPMLGTSNPDYGPLLGAMTRVGGFYLLGVVTTFAYNKILVYITQGTMRHLRDALFTRMQDLPIRYFDTHVHGDIMSVYTNDTDTLRQLISQSIPQTFNSLITIVSTFIYMVSLSVPLTLVTVAMVFVLLFVSKTFMSRAGRYFVAQQQNTGKLNGFVEEMLTGQKVVKVFTHEDENIKDFRALNEELFQSSYNANRFSSYLGPDRKSVV